MGSQEKTPISLEALHRHFLVTHLKGEAACVLNRLERRAKEEHESFAGLLADLMGCWNKPGAYRDDKWFAKDIPVDGCYFAHTDFRHRRVPKDQRFVDFLGSALEEIELGSFPCSWEIRAPWEPTPMPAPLVQERGEGKYYVLDGQLRVIRHWYHGVPSVSVFIYRGESGV